MCCRSTMVLSNTDYVLDELFNSRNMPSDGVVCISSSNRQLEGNYLHNDIQLPSEIIQLDNNWPKEFFDFHSSYLKGKKMTAASECRLQLVRDMLEDTISSTT